MPKVEGGFDVATLAQLPEADEAFSHISRLLLDKVFRGPLAATSKGEMLAMGAESGWGVYVAIERVSGELEGRRGEFVLCHGGTRTSDSQHLSIRVVPGSGTGDLSGISGEMAITAASNGAHSYSLDYRLP